MCLGIQSHKFSNFRQKKLGNRNLLIYHCGFVWIMQTVVFKLILFMPIRLSALTKQSHNDILINFLYQHKAYNNQIIINLTVARQLRLVSIACPPRPHFLPADRSSQFVNLILQTSNFFVGRCQPGGKHLDF